MELKKIILLSIFLFNQKIIASEDLFFNNDDTIFNKISHQLLKSSERPTLTREEIRSIINPDLPSKIDNTKLTEILKHKRIKHKNQRIVLERFEENEKKSNINKSTENSCYTSAMFWQNTELFCGQNTLSAHLLSKINRTTTEVGYIMLSKKIAEPTTDINESKKSQDIVKELIENEELFNALDSILKEYVKIESDLLTFWDQKVFYNLFGSDFYYPPEFLSFIPDSVMDTIFPQKIKNHLNKSPGALHSMALADNLQSFKFFIHSLKTIGVVDLLKYGSNTTGISEHFPRMNGQQFKYGDNKWKNIEDNYKNLKREYLNAKESKNLTDTLWHSFWTFWAFDSIGYDIFEFTSTISLMSDKFKGETRKLKTLTKAYSKLQSASKIIKSLISIKEETDKNSLLLNNLDCYDTIQYLFDKTSSGSNKFDGLLELLIGDNFSAEPNAIRVMLSRGTILASSYLMKTTQNRLIDIMKAIGQIDAYLSIAKLYKESIGKDATYSFAQYIDQENPYINLKDYWTPFIDQEKVVTNDIELGKNGFARNAIISGPNAGGKSTILKAIIINLLLAQTIGIAPCKQIIFTPFNYLDTYLNIVDDISAGNSLFKAEVLRIKELLETLYKISPGKCFVIMDEMFSGTNPIEGEAAGCAVGMALAKMQNCITMIASHYPKMTQLEDNTNGIFKNYKVTVTRNEDKSLSYPFKIESGKTNQTIAIDILENENFDPEIINHARKMING